MREGREGEKEGEGRREVKARKEEESGTDFSGSSVKTVSSGQSCNS